MILFSKENYYNLIVFLKFITIFLVVPQYNYFIRVLNAKIDPIIIVNKNE